MRQLIRSLRTLSIAGLAAGGLATPSQAKVVSISKAAVENGQLVIAGKTTTGSETVLLDVDANHPSGIASATSDATTKDFSFALVYLPPDCIVVAMWSTPCLAISGFPCCSL